MKTTARIVLKKSVIVLFSFTMVAAMLSIINVANNATGNPFSSVTSAFADSGVITNGSISMQTDRGAPITFSSGGCGFGVSCGGSTQVGGRPSSGGSSSGGSVAPDPLKKSIFYNCASVSGNGNCNVQGVTTIDSRIYRSNRVCSLQIGQTYVASNGDAAVSYLVNNVIGQADGGWGWFVPWNDPERLFIALTNYPAAGNAFQLPGDWWNPDISTAQYNGTMQDMTFGAYRWHCWDQVYSVPAFAQKNVTCGPINDGRPFPYSVGYYVNYSNTNSGTLVYTDFYGNTQSVQNFSWNVSSASCVYVARTTPPPKVAGQNIPCYWNIGYTGNYSTNRSAILSGGSPTSVPPTPLSPPASKPYISGANSTAQLHNCTTQVDMNAALNLQNGYAYYRLTGSALMQRYQFYYWDPAYVGGQRLLANIVPQGTQNYSQSVYGTFTCQNQPNPYRQYPSWGSLPSITFSYAGCGEGTSWQCLIPNTPQINNTSVPVELMRDGNYIPTNLGGVKISGNGIRDISTGRVGSVSDGNMSFKVSVVPGSSPFSGTNANDANQYFKLWNPSKSGTIPWDTWVGSPNANKNSFLNFFWSSDNGQNWKMTYQAKLNTAQFAVPWQDTSKSAPYMKWVTDTNIDCNGVKTSNPATIMRSVTTTGG